MRILSILMGVIFAAAGIFLIANGGLSFMSVAFIVGMVFVAAGIVECLSYHGYRGENVTKSWIMIDGISTLLLGIVILMNKLSADMTVPLVLGMWIMMTGIRNFVHGYEKFGAKDPDSYSHMIIGGLSTVLGLYAFFNLDFFNFSTLSIIGVYMVFGGINLAHVGLTIKIVKPNFLKTKEELVEDATAKAAEAHEAAKEAIKMAKEAKYELMIVEQTPQEVLDKAMAAKPGTEAAAGVTTAEIVRAEAEKMESQVHAEVEEKLVAEVIAEVMTEKNTEKEETAEEV